MNRKNGKAMPGMSEPGDLPERLWAYSDFTAAESRPADFAAGLASLGFLKAALRRSRRLWIGLAVIGLLAGWAFFLAYPPAYQASTSLYMTHGPAAVPGSANLDDQAIAQSRAVAGLAVRKLRLRESVDGFLAAYTVTVVTDHVLVITVSAPSSSEAVSRANAVAAAFLRFRAHQLRTEQALESASLTQQLNQAEQRDSALGKQVSQVAAQPVSRAQQGRLASLRRQRAQSAAALTALKQTVYSTRASTQTTTTSQIEGSEVIDAAAPVPHSRLKYLLSYAVIGLLAGLVVGVGIVVVRALASERLVRRGDVARAIGAPVKLSVSAVKLGRGAPGPHWLAAAEQPQIRRIADHLAAAVPASPDGGPAALAVAPVDDPRVAALAVAALATSRARQGQKVVIADLAEGAPAAALLGVISPGTHAVDAEGARLVAAVPDADNLAPYGPLDHNLNHSVRTPFTEAVAQSCASADLLLALVTLDPALGGEHLATWAHVAVATVTAGRVSATRIHAVGEMIRLGGARLASVVLVGADKGDESLGVVHVPGSDPDAELTEMGLSL